MASVPQALRQQVTTLAKNCCEYCQTQQRLTGMPLVLDHIQPQSLGGSSDLSNLAASCYRCNQFKGAKTEAVDPLTQQVVSLFHPRQQSWAEHFTWADEGIQISGLTSSGRATVEALRLNNPYIVESRKIWVAENWHPPDL
ncbi:HNH endonuclease [filamentous cyanobacterium CCT1]|nr:HNH endonuclease [filamentous cyanobacterium CCT1]PSN76419.1 HNH endonuclease [filamentous cyanobacterium CCP4]